MAISGNAFDWPVLKKVFVFVKPYKTVFYNSIALTILLAIIAPLRPILIQYTLDRHIVSKDYDGLVLMTALMIFILIAQSFFQYLNTYLTNQLGQDVIKDLRIALYKKILRFRLKYFDNTPVGTLITRVISDMETIADIFSEGLIVIIGDILQLVVVIIVMFYTDWRLTLMSLSTLPFLFIATNVFKNGIKSAFNEVRTQVAHLNTFVQEHLTGMNIVQVFNREAIEMEKFTEINKLHMKAHIKSIWYYSIFFPIVEILSATSIGLMIWWGAKEALWEGVSVGNLVAFIIYINMLFRPIRELADKFNTLQMGMVSSERVFKVLETESHIIDEGTKSSSRLEGKINFENVWFAYNEENWVLKNIQFEATTGQTIALVGATGAGKSSIINLLNRFYEINKGKILIDNIEIKDYSLKELRKSIAIVLQDVFLFADSIFNNITLNNPEISKGQVIEASKAVGAHDFISKLPGNYDYNVQERGGTLSTGQRQLISFIRAYVYNPKILVLDEATSSIDSESELLIQKATEILTKGRTSIVIAHRLSTIQKADNILVLEQGEIIEQGNHQQLLKLNGHYKKLYELQFSPDQFD